MLRAFWLSVFVLAASPVFAGEPLYTLSAAVSEVQPAESAFKAKFNHPATGEQLEYAFKVTRNTGMNGLKDIADLEKNDLLQIDYYKTADGTLTVEYMARVKLKKAPNGLEKFNPAELVTERPLE